MNKKHKINGTTDLLVYLAEGRNLKLESLGKINQRNPKISNAFMRKQKYISAPYICRIVTDHFTLDVLRSELNIFYEYE